MESWFKKNNCNVTQTIIQNNVTKDMILKILYEFQQTLCYNDKYDRGFIYFSGSSYVKTGNWDASDEQISLKEVADIFWYVTN